MFALRMRNMTDQSTNAATRKTTVDWLIFAGFIALYFALQLWILPKLGIGT